MATNGRGDYPFNSGWSKEWNQFVRPIRYADDETATVAVWTDWFFEAPSDGSISGSLAVVQGSDTSTGQGNINYSGSASIVAGGDTSAASGNIVYGGTLAAAQAADTSVGSGNLIFTGSLDLIQADQFVAATGNLAIPGSLGLTQADQTLAAAGGGYASTRIQCIEIHGLGVW